MICRPKNRCQVPPGTGACWVRSIKKGSGNKTILSRRTVCRQKIKHSLERYTKASSGRRQNKQPPGRFLRYYWSNFTGSPNNCYGMAGKDLLVGGSSHPCCAALGRTDAILPDQYQFLRRQSYPLASLYRQQQGG